MPKDYKIRTRILSKLEQNPKIVAEEWERTENLRHNTARTEEHDIKNKCN